ncbi:hypothetical protein KQH61_05990 [bacterium]|nr:hypothetical protein [bacterium]
MSFVGPQTTSNLSNAIITRYLPDYIKSASRRRFYHQIVTPVDKASNAAQQADSMARLAQASTIQVNFLSDMEIRKQTISETGDIIPQALRDQVASFGVDMYQDAVQWSEKTDIQAYTNYGMSVGEKVGLNLMETIEQILIDVIFAGGLVERAAARTSLDAGTAGHLASDDHFAYVSARLKGFHTPGFGPDENPVWAALTDDFVVNDIVTNSGGQVLNVAQYQDKEMVLNREIGKLTNFKIVADAGAKIFYGAGAANGSDADTTLAAAATAGSVTITVSSATNIAVGDWLNLITAKESGTTFYPHNERVKVISVSGTTIGVAGQGDNGGLRFDHANGSIVNKDDSVHTIVYGGPWSIGEVYAPSLGRFGEMRGPFKQGVNKIWNSLGFVYYGGFGLIAQKHLYRSEVSVSEEA